MKTLSNLLVLLCIAVGGSATTFAAPSKESKPDELGWAFEYDAADRVTKITDPAGRDTRIDYAFDKATQHLRKRVRTTADGASVSHEFDDAGRLIRLADGVGEVSYGYDERGQLQSVQRQGGPAITYTYDAQSRITQRQVGDFFTLKYTYDFLGRLAAMDTPAGRIEYDYQTGKGEVIRKFPNGVWTISTYAPTGELQKIQHGRASNITAQGYSFAPLAEYRYRYRPDGLIAEIGEDSGGREFSRTYTYDTVGRLIRADGPDDQTHTYEYDPLGNRLKAGSSGRPTQTGGYDWIGRLTRLNDDSTAHDATGNLASVTLGGVTMTYRYNADGQLAEAGGGKVIYRYDGEGRLIARKLGEAETSFIPDPLSPYWQPLVMTAKDGSRTLIVWEGATPLMLIRNGQPEYLLHDHLGSVRLVADAEGKVTQRFEYDPFGTIMNPGPASEFAPRFAGLFWDAEAKVYLTLKRAYSPYLGRFMGLEPQHRLPSSSQEDLSAYAYCGGDPINYRDVDGKWRQKEPAQEYSPQMSMYVLEYIRQKEAEFQSILYPNKTNLTYEERKEIRKTAVEKFFGEHASYRVPGIGGYQYQGQLFGRIINKIMPTPYGAVNIDWATTLGHAEATSGISAGHLYGIGKTFWNIVGPLTGKKPLPEWGYAYPIPDKNAITWIKSLYNPDNSLEDVILPETMRGNQTGRISSASETWHGAVIHTMSGRATAEEIATAKAEGSYIPLSDRGGNPTATPSPVGGVYLGGAGKTLEGIGLLDGVAQDANGTLVLLGQAGGDIKLPPLRLDDVVTVFRSVYLHGEGPTVTIDPNPENPTGSAMIIRHSEATEGTYVGWVLYQADRLMKSYNLGKDNLTKLDVSSAVPGYANVLDAIYFGGGQTGNAQKGGSWERFWIVPRETRRFASAPEALTLFDVPLKVRTQPMKWEKGQLVDDPNRSPSPGAAAFTDWFTGTYEGIAHEQYLTPPPESGITQPVPVFTELRRIALLTAIAEKLRDQGIPMPFWMRDYLVQPVPFEKTTPALEITRHKERITARIFGGVNLSPATTDTYTQPSELAKLPKEQQAAAQETLERSASLAKVVRKEMLAAEPLKVKTFLHQGKAQQALALPGATTLALAPNRLDAVDLVVPIEGGGTLQLVRSYNSFFHPTGLWDQGWALDLPRLEEAVVPLERDEHEGVKYRMAYEVLTPLNTVSARFSHIDQVPELNGSRLLVPDPMGEFLALAEGQPDFVASPTKSPTRKVLDFLKRGHDPSEVPSKPWHKLIRRDGEIWYFSPAGDLAATERSGFRTVYERDKDGRLTGIVGIRGKQLVASIHLGYDAAGRLQTATGQRETSEPVNAKDKATVTYDYDASGKLVAVRSTEGRTGYHYQGPLVTAVTYQGPEKDDKEETVRQFEYNPHGQLLAQVDADKTRTEYQVSSDATGSTLTIAQPGKATNVESVSYDAALRPVKAQYAHGAKVSWDYSDGGSAMILTPPEGGTLRFSESADRRQRVLELDKQRKIAAEYDTAGRLTTLTDNGQILLRQEWLPDGRLRVASNDSTAVQLDYDEDGLVSRVILAPPGGPGKGQPWRETKLDPAGRPLEITDYRGLRLLLDYDAAGELRGIVNHQGGQNLGFAITRDPTGRIQQVESSWGKQLFTYDREGWLERVEVVQGADRSLAEWDTGRLVKVRQFDGGETQFRYGDSDADRGRLRQITVPNGLALDYQYDKAGRLNEVGIGGAAALSLTYDDSGRVKRWVYHAVAQ